MSAAGRRGVMDLDAVSPNDPGADLVRDRGSLVSYLREAFQVNAADRQSSPRVDHGVLNDFVQSIQPWSRERVPLPRRLRRALWITIPVELFWAIWLATIVTGATSCDGPICTVATLNHHAAALLACGVFSIAGLAGLVPTTRGFAKCNGIEVIGLTIVSAAGGAALLGVAALVIGALIALAILATFVLAATATSRRETDYARARTPFPIAPTGGANPFRTHRAERSDQRQVAEPAPSAPFGVDRDSPGFS
jgi:hypothetical protein